MHSTFKRLLAGAMIAVTASAVTTAQQRPDFSGTWVATKDAPAGLPAATSPVFYERFAIKHAGQKVEIHRPNRGSTWVTTHTLDGSETRVGLPANTCFGQSGQIVTMAWD